MYQVSFNSLLYFQRYALDKLFIAKIKKESNSVNTGDRVMVRALEILKSESVQPMMMTSSMSPFPKKKNMCISPVTKTNDNWQSYNSF